MVEIYNGSTVSIKSNIKGANTDGLLYDIQEDEGYEKYDLILTVLEFIVDDVRKYMASVPEGDMVRDERDRDKLYALIGLLNEVEWDVLLQYLPKEQTLYLSEKCGALRLESWTSQNRMVSRDNICPGESE